jgi:hypothetical protein
MKNNRYKPLIDRAKELGCSIEYGGKHAKVYRADGRLIVVWSVNSSKNSPGNPAAEMRKFEKLYNTP